MESKEKYKSNNKEKIRVLHYIPGFLYGGIESMFLSWYENIDKDSFDFDLILRTQDDSAEPLNRYKNMGGTYYRLNRLSMRNINRFRRSAKDFFCKYNDYDIMHMHGMDLFVAYYAHKYGIKNIILHSHASRDDSGIKTIIKNKIDDIGNRYVTDIFACSEKAAERLLKKKTFANKKASIIRNAIDCSKYVYNEDVRYKKRKELGFDTELIFGHVARLTEPKNQFFLIDIFKNIHERKPSSRLVIIGDGPLEDELRQYAKELGVEKEVIFLGRRNDVAELLQALDCFLLPSLHEGLPVTVVEAQATGLPCVISDIITDEVVITDLVHRISLDYTTDNWAREIFAFLESTDKRSDRNQDVASCGFDIRSAVKELEKQYRNIISRKERIN